MLWERLSAELTVAPPVIVTCDGNEVVVQNVYLLDADFEVADYATWRFHKLKLRPGESARVAVSDCEKTAVHVRHPYREFLPIFPKPRRGREASLID